MGGPARGYAVVEVQTSGFSPLLHDRILDVAVIQLDRTGDVEATWSTLLDPGRSVGHEPHGIVAEELTAAPTMDAAAPTLGSLVAGRVLVSHNAAFTARFLGAELRAAGQPLPFSPETSHATMALAATYLPASGRGLSLCCELAGVDQPRGHSALGDARAVARLMRTFLGTTSPGPWQAALRAAAQESPSETRTLDAVTEVRRSAPDPRPYWMSRLADRMPRSDRAGAADAYLALLDLALLDRFVDNAERDALMDAARALGLTYWEVEQLHRGYIRSLAVSAMFEGVVSASERADVASVAEKLRLRPQVVEAAFDAVDAAPHRPRLPVVLDRGDEVVFTGDLVRRRGEWRTIARQRGLRAERSVSPQTRVLVAADRSTLAGKARVARHLRTPIVSEDEFTGLLRALA